MTFKRIEHNTTEYEEMIHLRNTVLLQPIGVPVSFIQREKEAADWLLCAFEKEKMIACCVLTRLDNTTVQLRQMAVLQEMQGKGVGEALIRFAEGVALEEGFQTLIMHARDAVLPFYQKCGYSVAGEQFYEVGIPHHKMKKTLLQAALQKDFNQ